MIWKPRFGDLVEIRYRKGVREYMPLHGERGWVEFAPCGGRGPRNVVVRIGLSRFAVPRGNLFRRN